MESIKKNIKSIMKNIKNNRKYLYSPFFIMTVISVSVCTVVCIINYFNVDKAEGIFFGTTSSETDEFIFEHGMGFERCIKKGQDESEKIIKTYNRLAGDLSNWNNEMSLSEFNIYSTSVSAINGIIINTDIHEEYIEYTYKNENKLKVNLIKVEEVKEYALSRGTENEYEITKEDGYNIKTYKNGYTEVVRVIHGIDSEVIAYDFDAIKLIKDTGIVIVGCLSILAILLGIMIAAFYTELDENKGE